MSKAPAKNTIENYKIRLKDMEKEYSAKQLIRYYGLPVFIVLKKHSPAAIQLCGEGFAKILLATDHADKDGLVSIYADRGDFETELLHLFDDIFDVRQNVITGITADLMHLDMIYDTISESHKIIAYFSRHIKASKDFEAVVKKTFIKLGVEQPGAHLVFKEILGELSALTTEEFKTIQSQIYQTTKNRLEQQCK